MTPTAPSAQPPPPLDAPGPPPHDSAGPAIAPGGLFGRIALSLGFCQVEHVQMAVAMAAEDEVAGRRRRLGEILLEAGALTAEQVAKVLEVQRKTVLRCPACHKRWNAAQATGREMPRCPQCRVALEPPPELSSVGVERTIEQTDTSREGAAPDPERHATYDALVGRTLGPYHVERLLGEGGMGAVFRARHTLLNRLAALKIVRPDLSHEQQRVRRFLREAESLAQVRHPNIVEVHNVGSADGFYFIEMELVEGGTLAALLQEGEPLPLDRVLGLVRQTAAGLGAAHARGIVHRDVKPDNILLTPEGTPKIADFGLARAIEGAGEGRELTADRSILGTPNYMSPEQCRGAAADARSDVYALGILLYQAVTGVRPFDSPVPMVVVMRHLNKECPSPRILRPDLPLPVANLIERMVAKDPRERYADGTAVAEAIDAYAGGKAIAYTARRIRRRRARLALAAVLLTSLGAGAGVLWSQFGGETREAQTTRLAGQARAAFDEGMDALAGEKLAELAGLVPEHPELALRARLARRAEALAAWGAGEAAQVCTLVPTDDRDPRLAALRERAVALVAARRALAEGRVSDVVRASRTVLAREPHREAEGLRDAALALGRAIEAERAGDLPGAVVQARGALALRSVPAAADLQARALETLCRAVTVALAGRDLPAAETAAARLAGARPDDAASTEAARAVAEARAAWDQHRRAAETHLASRDGAGTAEHVAAAARIWDAAALAPLRAAGRTWDLRHRAALAAQEGHLVLAVTLVREACRGAGEGAAPDLLSERGVHERRLAAACVADARAAVAAGALALAAERVAAALDADPDGEAARALATEIRQRRATPEDFCFVPGGEYGVGGAGEIGNPRRGVELRAFCIARNEVTNAEFARFAAAGGYTSPAHWPEFARDARGAFVDVTGQPGPAGWRDGRCPAGTEPHPVTGVSWAEAAAYAAWAGARLPTEDEWEVAAAGAPGGGPPRAYSWGDVWDPARVGLSGAAEPALAAVGTRPGDVSAWGCADLAGNAMEWTLSDWASGADRKVIRGGSTHPIAADNLAPEEGCRAARRRSRAHPLTARVAPVGFRLVRETAP